MICGIFSGLYAQLQRDWILAVGIIQSYDGLEKNTWYV